MKTIITSFALLVLTVTTARAQEPTMEDNLKEAYAIMDTAKGMPSLMTAAAKFDLIANKYQDQWVAQYYSAYTKAIISYFEPDIAKKDLYVDEADAYLDKIVALGTENDHVFVLKALVANARMAVDGEHRWQEYGPIFEENLKKAKELNENNPHIYYLKAVSVFYTPKMFGGGAKKAKPYFEKAKEKYALMTERSVMIPYWGEPQNEDYLKQVNAD
ncbi:MAG: hypothetical protein V4604_15500 [Bacteroidota bacterium]